MPMDRSKYPPDWDDIAKAVKEAAGWRCELCNKPCRRPGEKHTTHKITLTVAHINHVEGDCRPENLSALCAPCHLRYDAKRKTLQKRAAKRIARMAKETLLNGENAK